MKIFGLLFFTLISFSCNSVNSISDTDQRKDCVHELTEAIKDKWFYYPENNTYNEGDGFLKTVYSVEFQSCLKVLNADGVISVFGKPNFIVGDRFYYMYHTRPYKENSSSAPCMFIDFKKDGFVDNINLVPVS